ncbi:MAG: 50S ribosomal protein L23 [SAR202 cluster bacterium]|nr:50S ribosomal protein L23 [SAR202 cluster bacterium]
MATVNILKKPLVTEKSTRLMEKGWYVFEVANRASKLEIKKAVETAFNVKVVSVNTMRIPGERRRMGPRFTVTASWKKAVVKLSPGQRITIFEGV